MNALIFKVVSKRLRHVCTRIAQFIYFLSILQLIFITMLFNGAFSLHKSERRQCDQSVNPENLEVLLKRRRLVAEDNMCCKHSY